MSKPRLLDLFSGAGGSARGYQMAGFYVVGVDHRPQPRYAGDEFHQADALTFPLDGFDAIHASPPCQAFSSMALATGHREKHANLIPQTRERLVESGLTYVIENVRLAPVYGLTLCGASFGLEVIRHRIFESNLLLVGPPCSHKAVGSIWNGAFVAFRRGRSPHHGRRPPRGAAKEFRAAMGVEWMNLKEMTQAIPPAYTNFLGRQLMAHLASVAA